MKIGVFGGSFNPVHIGHLALANYMCEYENLEEIWFMISPQNPLKSDRTDLLDKKVRFSLLQEAVRDYQKFKISMVEWDLPRPSYTVNVLRELKNVYPEHEFYFMIGSDNWNSFYLWKDCDYIIDHFNILVYPRSGYPINAGIAFEKVKFCYDAPVFKISSSFIRESILKGKDIRFFLPYGVYERIIDEGLIK